MTERSDEQWTDRHRPTTFNEIQGNTTAIDRLKEWAKDFPDDREPRLLVGPPGVGKTTTVEVIADWLNLQLVELNASSARKSDDIEQMASLIRSRTADGERRVILLDEVDSWHHAADKKPLYDALDSPANIVFCTANDKWETPNGLVNRCEMEKFKLGTRSIKAKLKKIRDAEGIDLSDDALDSLADRPDLRSAINDLQVFANAAEVPEDSREWEMDEMDMVDAMMTGTAAWGDLSPGEVILWLDENLSADWRGLELAWGYEALSLGEVAMMRDKRAVVAILETLPDLRISEPYRSDEISWKKKSFPNWFRHSKPKASGGSSEAKLYRALKGYDSGEFSFAGSFVRFLEVQLPILQDLDPEERYELILNHDLSPEEYDALGVRKAQYENWLEVESPEGGESLSVTEDASAW